MLANLWRFLVALCDFRTLARYLTGRPTVDVVFISNLRDEADRRRFFGRRPPPLGHANGPRIHLGGVIGRLRGIYMTAEEIYTRDGRRKAREQFIAAVEWAVRRGARVVLLAASTKRLFGRDGQELRERFPGILFTIGDNGTANMLHEDVFRALWRGGLRPGRSRVMVIGPYGILGETVTRDLVEAGYEVIGYGSNAAALAEIVAEYGIAACTQLPGVAPVDAVVACTHSAAARLDEAAIELLRRPDRRLLVIDVAEPANLDRPTHARCADRVLRQDAGNAAAPGLRYVLGGLSSRMLMLAPDTVFGCFAEALALHHAIHVRGLVELADVDWFAVDPATMQRLTRVFAEVGLGVPVPRCFGEPVVDYTLDLAAAWPDEAAAGMQMAKMEPLPTVD